MQALRPEEARHSLVPDPKALVRYACRALSGTARRISPTPPLHLGLEVPAEVVWLSLLTRQKDRLRALERGTVGQSLHNRRWLSPLTDPAIMPCEEICFFWPMPRPPSKLIPADFDWKVEDSSFVNDGEEDALNHTSFAGGHNVCGLRERRAAINEPTSALEWRPLSGLCQISNRGEDGLSAC